MQAPSRLRVIEVDVAGGGGLRALKAVQNATEKNAAFARDLERASIWRVKVANAEALRREVEKAVVKSVVELAKTGSREARRGRFDLGAPLDWSRLTYKERRDVLVQTVAEYLETSRDAKRLAQGHVLQLGNTAILVRVSGVPAGMGTAEAREMVGRPYLDDHELVGKTGRKAVGPLHIIACHTVGSDRAPDGSERRARVLAPAQPADPRRGVS